MLKTILLLIMPFLVISGSISQPVSLTPGAFTMHDKEGEHTLILQDNYFMHAVYTLDPKEFKYSEGGTCIISGDSLFQVIEFSTNAPQTIGEKRYLKLEKNSKGVMLSGKQTSLQNWTRVDEGNAALAGNWRITGRKEGDSIRQMQRGARKTLKILSGSRFQWAAINPQTKEFFGTGGGTYTFENGKYTENIQFFSRDNSRVGASLSFTGEIKDSQWHHSGKSSTGNPIYEIWSREK